MTNSEKYYVEKVAHIARQSVKDAGIQITVPMTFKLVIQIIEHFGGKLIKKENDDYESSDFYIRKNNNEELEVYYNENYSGNKVMKLLHELGHVFFDFPDMKIGEKRGCDDAEPNDIQAELFARAFVMPREDFEKDMVKNTTKDGKFDMIKLAEYYGVEYMDTLTRGEDLNLWH